MTGRWIPRLAFIALLAASFPVAARQVSDLPPWLAAHVGEKDGEIAPVVLQRARALYQQKLRDGAIGAPCYFAMDATRPADLGQGQAGRRFYVICEAARTFRAISAGHGSGRNLKGIADFSNGRECARNFGTAQGSLLSAGGAYVTAETRVSFKGYYRNAVGKSLPLMRAFVQFEGEGETANARERAIGGHPALLLGARCRRKMPDDPHADAEGYVVFGKLVRYDAGRSNGCTSWSAPDAAQMIPMLRQPTTLYIYPESRDISAIAHALRAGLSPSRSGLYWNTDCLKRIGTPEFWPAARLEPMIARYERTHPAPAPRPLPICQGP